MRNVKDVVGLVLSLILVKVLLPTNEVDKIYFKRGVLVKVKWLNGEVSILKNGEWIKK